MRRGKYAIILFVLLVIFLLACQTKGKPDAQQPEDNSDKRLVEAVASDSLGTGGMTKLREFSTDLDLDNTEEIVELYTAAERNEKGDMMWDDGQNWILSVRDGNKSYPLLSQYVQLGAVYFTVSNNSEGHIPAITVIVSTDASLSMKGYAYDSERNGFREELLYKSKDDNWIYSSIPGY